jgi:hypothetical protein
VPTEGEIRARIEENTRTLSVGKEQVGIDPIRVRQQMPDTDLLCRARSGQVESGRYAVTRSARSRMPRSTCCKTSVAVKTFVIDPKGIQCPYPSAHP